MAEFVGTALLLTVVVGSGIAVVELSRDPGLRLFAHAAVTGAGLAAIIQATGPVSGAHLNPAVSLADRCFGGLTTRELGAYVGAQVAGAVVGTAVANVMFSRPVVAVAGTVRAGGGLWLSEAVATLGLLLVIFGVVRSRRPSAVAGAVGSYIAAAIVFTSSTGFANPAVTVGRMLSDTFTGIAPVSAPAFLAFQLLGALAAVALVAALYPNARPPATDAVEPLPSVGAPKEVADD